jgi:uncharacterized iron-regulated membrane protein
VLYWPFTRRLSFGTLRDKSRRIAWFDWHNLLGAITIAWALVVGATGVINTLAEVMLNQWKANELADMVKPYAGKPPPVHFASLDVTLDRARRDRPRHERLVRRLSGYAVHELASSSRCSCAATRR